MRRILILSACALALAGCTGNGTLSRAGGVTTSSYLLVSSKGRTLCYTRVVRGRPVDQVCQRRNFLRYTQNPMLGRSVPEPPAAVLALFDSRGGRVGVGSAASANTLNAPASPNDHR